MVFSNAFPASDKRNYTKIVVFHSIKSLVEISNPTSQGVLRDIPKNEREGD